MNWKLNHIEIPGDDYAAISPGINYLSGLKYSGPSKSAGIGHRRKIP